MHRAVVFLLAIPLLLAAEEPSTGQKPAKELKPGLFSRMLDTFRGSPDRINRADEAGGEKLEVSIDYTPDVVRLDETRRLAVEVVVANGSKKIASLNFPTAQRMEIQIVDSAGNVVTKWSDDRAFAQAIGHVAINPGEKIVYRETVSLRELRAGEAYVLEAFLPGYPDLSAKARLVPEG